MNIEDYRQIIQKAKVNKQSAEQRLLHETEALGKLKIRLADATEAQTIAQKVAQTIQQRVHQSISSVVSRCLESVFDFPYSFCIRWDAKRGKTEAVLVFVRDGVELDDPQNEVGGGVIDIAALALRLSAVMLSRPPRRRVLVLDEPFRNVRGMQNKQRVRAMMLKLAEDLGFQFVLNVDADAYPEFAMGSIVEVGN